MLKNILKLNGAQELSKNEQKEVNGGSPFGIHPLGCNLSCPSGCLDCKVIRTISTSGGWLDCYGCFDGIQ